MSLAWETTIDDVDVVIIERFETIGENQVAKIYDDIDHDKIEDAALNGNSVFDQVEYAYDEIERQIREDMGLT